MKITQLTVVAALMLTVMMLSTTAITAQEEPKPEPEIEEAKDPKEAGEKAEAADKPLWDDGSEVGRFILELDGVEVLLKDGEFDKERVDYIVKHFGGFCVSIHSLSRTVRSDKPLPTIKMTEQFRKVIELEEYQDWAKSIGEPDPEALLRSFIRLTVSGKATRFQKRLLKEIEESETLLKNAEVLKDISKKEYDKAKKTIAKELEVIAAKQSAIKDIIDPSKAEMKLIEDSKEDLEKSLDAAFEKLREDDDGWPDEGEAMPEDADPEPEAEDGSDTPSDADPESDE